MSIVTKTGDKGTTALMYGRRVMKYHPRIEAAGAVDELNSALGLARAAAELDPVRESLLPIQKELVILMGELAVPAEEVPRYTREGRPVVTAEMTARLEKLIGEIEATTAPFDGWATPGANQSSAALDLARAVCRRAERHVCRLLQTNELNNSEIIIYLNRLSDFLWLLARWVEAQHG